MALSKKSQFIDSANPRLRLTTATVLLPRCHPEAIRLRIAEGSQLSTPATRIDVRTLRSTERSPFLTRRCISTKLLCPCSHLLLEFFVEHRHSHHRFILCPGNGDRQDRACAVL